MRPELFMRKEKGAVDLFAAFMNVNSMQATEQNFGKLRKEIARAEKRVMKEVRMKKMRGVSIGRHPFFQKRGSFDGEKMVVALRIQFNRQGEEYYSDIADFAEDLGFKEKAMALAAKVARTTNNRGMIKELDFNRPVTHLGVTEMVKGVVEDMEEVVKNRDMMAMFRIDPDDFDGDFEGEWEEDFHWFQKWVKSVGARVEHKGSKWWLESKNGAWKSKVYNEDDFDDLMNAAYNNRRKWEREIKQASHTENFTAKRSNKPMNRDRTMMSMDKGDAMAVKRHLQKEFPEWDFKVRSSSLGKIFVRLKKPQGVSGRDFEEVWIGSRWEGDEGESLKEFLARLDRRFEFYLNKVWKVAKRKKKPLNRDRRLKEMEKSKAPKKRGEMPPPTKKFKDKTKYDRKRQERYSMNNEKIAAELLKVARELVSDIIGEDDVDIAMDELLREEMSKTRLQMEWMWSESEPYFRGYEMDDRQLNPEKMTFVIKMSELAKKLGAKVDDEFLEQVIPIIKKFDFSEYPTVSDFKAKLIDHGLGASHKVDVTNSLKDQSIYGEIDVTRVDSRSIHLKFTIDDYDTFHEIAGKADTKGMDRY